LLVTKPQKLKSKTAYVDTSVLMKNTETKDLEAKYKAQSEEKEDN
jgi:hypothetical protein